MLSENQTYAARLDARRAEILKALDEVPPEGLDWTPLPRDTSSIAVLAVHALGAERKWLHDVVGREQVDRNRESEFKTRAADLGEIRARYAATAQETDQVLSRLTAEEMEQARVNGRYTESVRWCILHVIEHYSEHLAQIWLTRQLYESKK